MGRNRAKKIVLNPVLQIPWIAQFRDFEKITELQSFVLNLSLDNDVAQDLCVSKRNSKRYLRVPLRPTKTALTRIYTDQIKPNYPNFTKTHVKAALMLTDNNLEEARIILDLKGRFESIKKQRKPISLIKESTRTVGVNRPALDLFSTFRSRTNAFETNSSTEQNVQTENAGSKPAYSPKTAPLGSFPGVQGISAISTIPSFIDTPLSTPNSEAPLNSYNDTSLESECISDIETIRESNSGISTYGIPLADDLSPERLEVNSTIAIAESVMNTDDPEAVYEFPNSDDEDSSPSFSEWKLSKIGTSKITLKRNKVGVQISKQSNGYISTLL